MAIRNNLKWIVLLVMTLTAVSSTPRKFKIKKLPLAERKGGFLWKIDVSPPSYLFGTLHNNYTHLIDLILPEMTMALDRIDHFYMEAEDRDFRPPRRAFDYSLDGEMRRMALQRNKTTHGIETPGVSTVQCSVTAVH